MLLLFKLVITVIIFISGCSFAGFIQTKLNEIDYRKSIELNLFDESAMNEARNQKARLGKINELNPEWMMDEMKLINEWNE